VKDTCPRDALTLYTQAAERSAAQIIGSYSTSFGAATRLLGTRHRQHVRNVYALVRIADELVDGVAAESGLCPEMQMEALNALEAETESALQTGFSSNPIVYAFAHTARTARFGDELTKPFFSSMRTDLEALQRGLVKPGNSCPPRQAFDESELAEYIYGSAEVVGLMCLRVFTREETLSTATTSALEHGARSLGAAFQTVNFLRDLGDDTVRLGRSYLTPEPVLTTAQHQRIIGVIREQLREAEGTLPLLPKDAQIAVRCALQLFRRLTDRLALTPTPVLYERRVRVPNAEKARVVIQSVVTSWGPWRS